MPVIAFVRHRGLLSGSGAGGEDSPLTEILQQSDAWLENTFEDMRWLLSKNSRTVLAERPFHIFMRLFQPGV